VQPEFYFTNRQMTRWATYFVLRTEGDPGAVARAIPARLHEIDRDLTPAQLRTLPELVSRELVRPRFNMLLVALFAFIALALAAIGVYGVIAYTVEMRTQEIGIRLALGATPRQIVSDTLAAMRWLLIGGAVAGVAGSLAFSRVLRSMLFGVSPTDPVAVAGAVVVLVACAALAALRPALRASRIDPAVSLRTE
jgi:ABC-type antimicrobial peptide transport system permease subunit